MKVRKLRDEIFKTLKAKEIQWRILYPVKLSFKTRHHSHTFLLSFKHGFLLFFYFFSLFYFIFNLTILYWFLPYINMNPPQVYTCSPSWTLLLPHTIPLDHPSAPAPSIQYHVSNLDWQLISYILYMFQCHSPKSSHPLPLPQSAKDWSIHQCLFCCLEYRVIVTIFLNFIYMH